MGLEHIYHIRHFESEGEQSSWLSAIFFNLSFPTDTLLFIASWNGITQPRGFKGRSR
jgi:hypothetical protein